MYLVGAEVRAAIIQQVRAFQHSQHSFEQYLQRYWGDVRYEYEEFLRDAAQQRGADWKVYYLAHALLVNRPEIPSIFMDVELDLLFLEGEWLPPEPAPEVRDDEVHAFFRLRRSEGFRVASGRRAERQLARIASGLSSTFAEDLLLLNFLCNRNNKRTERVVFGFPMWIIAGWDNYEGYLTGDELARLSRPRPNGFLSVFRKIVSLHAEEGAWVTRVLDRVADAHAKAGALGADAICIAVSSV